MSRAAIRYAKAILDSAHAKGAAADVNNDMQTIASTLAERAELSAFVQSPTTTSEAKEAALTEVFDAANPMTKGLFKLLAENKRFDILSNVAVEFSRQFDEMNGIEVAQVTTAAPMTAELEAKVLSKILTISNKKVVIKNIVDPSLIGGFIIRLGDKQYNASVAGRLQSLKREFAS